MKIAKITTAYVPKKGDLLLVQGPISRVQSFTVKEIIGACDRKEIILDKRKNTYFNLSMYFEKTSWVKDCRIVTAK